MMKPTRPKILTILGLGTVIVLGLVYWRFPSLFPFRDRRPKTEIFAEAFARGDFKRCYRLMGEDYRAKVPKSDFLSYWESRRDFRFAYYHGEVQSITRLPPRKYKFIASDILLPGTHPRVVADVIYEVRFERIDYVLYLVTEDGHTNSPIYRIRWAVVANSRRLSPAPSPTPRQGPIS